MRALLRYFVFTAAIVGLAWASVTFDIGGKSAASYVRERAQAWWAALSTETPPSVPKKVKKRPATKIAKKKRTAPVRAETARPVREIPPTELQSEPEATKRVNLLATAAKQAAARVEAEERDQRATRITPKQKKALDALLTNRQAP